MKSRNEIIIKELESRKKKKQGEKDGKKKKEKERIASLLVGMHTQAKAACTYIQKNNNFKHAYMHKSKHAANINIDVKIHGERERERPCMHEIFYKQSN